MKFWTLVTVYWTASAIVLAGEAVSSRFKVDLHAESRGEVFPGDAGTEVWDVSGRWTALTTTRDVDSNGDGIPDWWERKYGVSVGTLSPYLDYDGDGFTNLQEFNAGSNPVVADSLVTMAAVSLRHLVDTDGLVGPSGAGSVLNEVWYLSSLFTVDTVGRAPDTDKDGMPDWYERLYGLNPNMNDANLDADGDGRTNLQEYNAGTNPMLADDWTRSIAETSESFETDTRVYYTGGNPSFDETFAVVRISNVFICDTGGLYYDWDGDGIPNWWEARYSRNGSKTGLSATDDDDADGMSNYAEFVAYTDPTNTASKFVIGLEQIVVAPVKKQPLFMSARMLLAAQPEAAGEFALRWQSAQGRTYSVYTRESLSSGSWSKVADLEGTGDVVEYVPVQSKTALFFKVSVRLSDDY